MTIGWWVFAGCLAVPVYAFLGYPLLLKVMALMTRREIQRCVCPSGPRLQRTKGRR